MILLALKHLLIPALKSISEKIMPILQKKFPETTPEQTAWETLTILANNLEALETALTELHKAKLTFARSMKLIEKLPKREG